VVLNDQVQLVLDGAGHARGHAFHEILDAIEARHGQEGMGARGIHAEGLAIEHAMDHGVEDDDFYGDFPGDLLSPTADLQAHPAALVHESGDASGEAEQGLQLARGSGILDLALQTGKVKGLAHALPTQLGRQCAVVQVHVELSRSIGAPADAKLSTRPGEGDGL